MTLVPPRLLTISERPARSDAHAGVAGERREARITWLALMAPGTLLACGGLALVLSLAPWLVTFAHVPEVRVTALALLLVHVAVGSLVLQRHRWLAAGLLAALMLNALSAGVLLGADPQVRSPALAIGLAVAVMAVTAGGGRAALGAVAAMSLGMGAAMLGGAAGLLLRPPILWLPATTLSVETSFAGASGIEGSVAPLLTVLSVEPSFAGTPAADSTAEQLMLAVAVALVAVCVGTAVNLLWAHKAKMAVAARILATRRSGVRR